VSDGGAREVVTEDPILNDDDAVLQDEHENQQSRGDVYIGSREGLSEGRCRRTAQTKVKASPWCDRGRVRRRVGGREETRGAVEGKAAMLPTWL
jgi:hypothetical protein